MQPKIVRSPKKATSFCYSPDGNFLLLTGYTKQVSVYSLEKKRVISSLEIDDQPKDILPPIFSPDGTMFFVGVNWSDGGLNCGYVVVCNWDSLTIKHRIIGHRPGYDGSNGIWDPDNKRIVTTAFDYTAKVWNVNTGKKIVTRKAKKEAIMAAAISPDGHYLVLGCEFGYVTILNFQTYQEMYAFRVSSEDIQHLSISSDSRLLRVACGATGLKIFELETGIEKLTLPSNCWWRHSTSPGGDLIACTHTVNRKQPWTMAVHLWDLREQRCVATVPPKEGNAPVSCGFSPDGNYLAVSHDGNFAFSPDGHSVAVAHDKLELWEIRSLIKKGVDQSQFEGKSSHAIPATDTRTGLDRAAEMAIKRLKPSDGIKGMRFPAHLANCLVRVQSKCSGTKCFGHVQCACGERDVLLSTTDAFFEEEGSTRPRTAQWNGEHFFVVNARCSACGKNNILFDANHHGWNAVCVESETKTNENPSLVAWKCQACQQEKHRVSIEIIGEPMRDAILESGELLDETNWQEGFGAINIAIQCHSCGRQDKNWVAYESM